MEDRQRHIIDIVTEAARMGAAEVMRRLRPEDDLISQRTAEAEFGPAFVRGCIRDGLVSYTRQTPTGRKTFSRAELEKARAAKSINYNMATILNQ